MPRINPSHHLQCYHSDSSHCLLSSITAVDSSQVSVLLLLPPAVFSQEKVGCDLLTLEVRLCASSAQISAVTPSSLRTSVTRVLTVAPQILHGLMLMTSLTSSPTPGPGGFEQTGFCMAHRGACELRLLESCSAQHCPPRSCLPLSRFSPATLEPLLFFRHTKHASCPSSCQ